MFVSQLETLDTHSLWQTAGIADNIKPWSSNVISLELINVKVSAITLQLANTLRRLLQAVPNRLFYSCLLGGLAFEWQRG